MVSPRCTRLCSGKPCCTTFNAFWPEKFTNVTNGVTPRRFLALANPPLAALITPAYRRHLAAGISMSLRKLEPLADDPKVPATLVNREAHGQVSVRRDPRRTVTGVSVDPTSIFDVQAKRLHEYKRQHLNALYIVALYFGSRATPGSWTIPRTFIFGGKAAPGYFMAKLIIKLINAIATW